MSPDQTVTLAHLSDIHLPPVAGFWPRSWNIKRTLGWLNWQRKRRFVHKPFALEAIVADMAAHAPDHILVSGDLVNIGLPAEYARAAAWLAALGPADCVSVVPGNHDAYVTGDAERGIGLWSRHMANDAFGRSLRVAGVPMMGAAFPFVRQVGPVAVIGVCSGVPTRPGSAQGEIGAAQMSEIAAALDATQQAGLVRLVMIHHPPVPGLAHRGRDLRDAPAFAELLVRHGAELIVHGHNHRMMASLRAGTAIEGVASASAALALGHEPLARYNLIRVALRDGETTISIETRGVRIGGSPVVSIASREILRLTSDRSAVREKGS